MAITLVAGACGDVELASSDSTTITVPPTSTTTTTPGPAGDRLDPGSQQASRSPEPVSEPILVPVPDPAAEPTKPSRPGLPTAPPPRPAPAEPVSPPDDAIADAIVDLADRLGVGVDAVELLDARLVTWRDGSVGCPEPGLAYTQAEVPGSLIVLRVGESSYRYHAAGGASFFYCDTPQAPLEGGA